MKFTLVATAMLALFFQTAHAEVFYVANDGNDANRGLSESEPLRSLANAAERISPGDRILLRRGDVFRESIEISTPNIELNAYGPVDRPRPVVSGSVPIRGFERFKDHIYVAKTSDVIGYLFVNNELMRIARYPNTGWLRTKQWTDQRVRRDATAEELRRPSTILTCEDLIGPEWSEDYWVGATVRWRHHSWWFETRNVVDYDRQTGQISLDDRSFLTRGSESDEVKGWGFYLDNKLEELDVPGEWFFDRDHQLVYLYPPDDVDPQSLLVEGSVLSEGLSVTDATVKNVCFRHQKDIGLRIDGRCVVENCLFEGIGRDATVSERGQGGAAIRAERGVTSGRISYNTFRNNWNIAIAWWQDRDTTFTSTIERNIVENSGVVPGYGGSGSWHGAAILVGSGQNVHVQYNRISKCGYAGILLGTDGNFAEYNFIKNAMHTLNDGGAIYTNCSRSTIRHNIILDTKGGMESSGSWPNIAHGIWPEFLREYRESIIEDNTCAGSGADGIFLPNNFECVVRNNVCYNNARYQMLLLGRSRQEQADTQQKHIISGNVFYSTSPAQNALYFDPRSDYGTLKDNYFCKPSSLKQIDGALNWPGTSDVTSYTLQEWQEEFAWADHSAKTCPLAEGVEDRSELFVNDSEEMKSIELTRSYRDLDGREVSGTIRLEPYTSRVLVRKE